MRMDYLLMYQGRPIVVSSDDDRLHQQAAREAQHAHDGKRPLLEWNDGRTRLFRTDGNGGSARFTGYEIRQVVRG